MGILQLSLLYEPQYLWDQTNGVQNQNNASTILRGTSGEYKPQLPEQSGFVCRETQQK